LANLSQNLFFAEQKISSVVWGDMAPWICHGLLLCFCVCADVRLCVCAV